MSRFDKFFNNIMNKESRLYRRLQDLDDLIYDRYFNEFAGKTVYTAEVLSESSEVDSEGPGGNSTMFKPIRVRIDGIHTNQIPDPYKAISGLSKEDAAVKFRTLFMSHPLAFPDTEIYSDSANSQPLNRGDRIEVFFAEEGPQNGGRQRGLRYGRVIAPAIARTVPEGASVSDVFEVGALSSVGDGAGIANPEILDGNEELKRKVEALIPYLQTAGYNEPITINSAVRTPQGQVQAMMGNLFKSDGNWDPRAKEWIKQYRDEGVKQLVNDNFEKLTKAQFEQKFSEYVIPNVSRITSHVGGNAVDIRTINIPYANVLIMRKGFDAAQSANALKSYAWERIDGAGFEENKEKRKNGSTLAIEDEHIHITFKDTESE